MAHLCIQSFRFCHSASWSLSHIFDSDAICVNGSIDSDIWHARAFDPFSMCASCYMGSDRSRLRVLVSSSTRMRSVSTGHRF